MDFNNFCNSLALPIIYRPNFLAFAFDPLTNSWIQSMYTKHVDMNIYTNPRKMIFFRVDSFDLTCPSINFIGWNEPYYLNKEATIFTKATPDTIIDLINKNCPEYKLTNFEVPSKFRKQVEAKKIEDGDFTVFRSIDTPPSTDYSWIIEYYKKIDVYAPLFIVLVIMIILSVKIINSSTPNSSIFNSKHAANNTGRVESQKIFSTATLKSKLIKFIKDFFKNKYNKKN